MYVKGCHTPVLGKDATDETETVLYEETHIIDKIRIAISAVTRGQPKKTKRVTLG